MVKLLFELGCPPDVRSLRTGWTAMHVLADEAAAHRDPGKVLAVAREVQAAGVGAGVDLIAAEDNDERRPLHLAADFAGGRAFLLDWLVQRGALGDALDDERVTALHVAVQEVRVASSRQLKPWPTCSDQASCAAVARPCFAFQRSPASDRAPPMPCRCTCRRWMHC